MSNYLLLVPMIIVGIIGSVIGGYVEEQVIPKIQNIPNEITDCNSLNPSWKEVCENQKTTYNTGITIFNIGGFVIGCCCFGGFVEGIRKFS